MHLATAVKGKWPKDMSARAASLYLALFFVVAAVSQLFAFENYPDVIASYSLPGLWGFDLPIAATIVALEVAAVPFLLVMRLSYLMRIVSMVCGWVVLGFWLFIGLWQSYVSFYIPNAGLFGSEVKLPQGWWLVSFVVALIAIAAYVAMAMWPIHRTPSHKRIVKSDA
jgi:hypothetical protein